MLIDGCLYCGAAVREDGKTVPKLIAMARSYDGKVPEWCETIGRRPKRTEGRRTWTKDGG